MHIGPAREILRFAQDDKSAQTKVRKGGQFVT